MLRSRNRLSWVNRIKIVLVLSLFPAFAWTQNSAARTDTLLAKIGDTIQLNEKFIVPHSLRIFSDGQRVAPEKYQVIAIRGQVILLDPDLDGRQIIFQYRHFLRFLRSSYAFRVMGQEDTVARDMTNYISPRYQQDPREVFDNASITKSGSISRGVTVGNKQSLSVTSGLRLQVDGDIGDGTRIIAAITDDNIPIQPDGTTQQIQDFDKVFIRILRDPHDLILGDYEINHTGTFFSNFYRNVQGIGVNYRGDNVEVSANAAQAKGKFHTNSFQGIENVLGPYRMTGRNNERFIIILAGSEKVYLNGVLMKRGEGNDYTIDYNTGELFFTSQQVINSSTRIVIDFEYSDRFYNRSLIFGKSRAKLLNDKLSVQVTYARDADNHNAPIDLTFSDDDRDTLRLAGDDALSAFSNGVDSVGFLANAIRYQRRDTTISGVVFERYILSTDPDSAIYDIKFALVGAGNGMYTRSTDPINGTVFEWVPPDAFGNPVGDYMPIKVLVLPRLLQVMDIKTEFKLSKGVKLYSENAISSDDKNRFSPIDDEDNFDLASKSGLRMTNIKVGDSARLNVDVSHKYVGQRFRNVDRINKIEYGREWNFDDLAEQQMENVTEAVLDFKYKRDLRLLANAGIRRMGVNHLAVKQLYTLESQHKWLQGKHTFTTIRSENQKTGEFSRWNRHNGDIYKRIGKLQPGVELWLEDKDTRIGDSVLTGTFRFWDVKPYLKTRETKKFSMHMYYIFRAEEEYLDSVYRKKSIAHTEYLKFVYNPTSRIRIQNTSSYRVFNLSDTAFRKQGLENAKTFVTNLQGNYSSKKRVVYANVIYEVTAEQLARKQEAFLLVNPGEGEYVWNDSNENGEQDLHEFQLAGSNLQGDYIRVVVPTQDLFPTTAVNVGGNLKLNFKKAFARSENKAKELLRNFLSITNFRVAQKREAGQNFSNYLVDVSDVFGDTTLLEARYILKQELWFFRNNSRGDLMFGFNDNKSKQFLITGTEARGQSFWESRQRLNFGRSKSVENLVKIGEKVTTSENIENRNFQIRFMELNPRVNFQISRKLRISTGYTFKDKDALSDSGSVKSHVIMHKVTMDARINLKRRNNIFAKMELVQINQTGEAGFGENYELRETLEPGFNLVTQAFATWYLSDNLELSLNYDLRLPNGKPPINTGRVQLKAFF